MLEEGKYSEALELAESLRSKAEQIENDANVEDDPIGKQYAEAMEKIYRDYVTGAWVSGLDETGQYTVILISDSDTEYCKLSFGNIPTARRVRELIAKELESYVVAVRSVTCSTDAARSVSFYPKQDAAALI